MSGHRVDPKPGDRVEVMMAMGNFDANVVKVEARLSSDGERSLVWVTIEVDGMGGEVPIHHIVRVFNAVEALARMDQ